VTTRRRSFTTPLKLFNPDEALAALVGSESQPQIEIVKKVWDYIRECGLQDSSNRHVINDDKNLQAIFGGQGKVSMFSVTKHVDEHLIEPGERE
jgi:chromatin remodeling complex protein RSC6